MGCRGCRGVEGVAWGVGVSWCGGSGVGCRGCRGVEGVAWGVGGVVVWREWRGV